MTGECRVAGSAHPPAGQGLGEALGRLAAGPTAAGARRGAGGSGYGGDDGRAKPAGSERGRSPFGPTGCWVPEDPPRTVRGVPRLFCLRRWEGGVGEGRGSPREPIKGERTGELSPALPRPRSPPRTPIIIDIVFYFLRRSANRTVSSPVRG